MSIENSQLQGIMNDALAGKTLLIQVADQTELNSNKVRLYRIRRSMESKIPDIVSRVSISQKSVEGKHYITVGPTKDLPVFEEKDGQLVQRETEKPESDLQRLIELLIRDQVPLDEVKEILRVWPKEAIGTYFHLKFIAEEQINGDNSKKAEEWDGTPGPEEG